MGQPLAKQADYHAFARREVYVKLPPGDEEEGMCEEETEKKKNDGNIGRTADPYVRRSLRVYSIFNPSVGDLVAEEM